MHDYTLQTTMSWEESELQQFKILRLNNLTDGVFYWTKRYLQENLKANDTSHIKKKFTRDDGTEILTGYKCFDDNRAGRMPLVVATMLQMRFREIVSLFFLTFIKTRHKKTYPKEVFERLMLQTGIDDHIRRDDLQEEIAQLHRRRQN